MYVLHCLHREGYPMFSIKCRVEGAGAALWGASRGCDIARTFQIRILRPLRVRFIVEKLLSTKMRSYSETDLQQTVFYVSFMSVIKKSLRTRKIAFLRPLDII